MNWVSFEFDATYCNAWPKIKFFIDNDLYQDYEFSNDKAVVTLPFDLLPGKHQLWVELYDKTENNTILEHNTVVQDQLVILKKIAIDNVKVPDLVLYRGTYYTNNQKIYPQTVTWGENGKWVLEFETPIINWILDLKLETFTNNKNYMWSSKNLKSSQLFIEELDKLEKLLSDVAN